MYPTTPPGLKSLGKFGSRRLWVFSLPGVGKTPLQPLIVGSATTVAAEATLAGMNHTSASSRAVRPGRNRRVVDIGCAFRWRSEVGLTISSPRLPVTVPYRRGSALPRSLAVVTWVRGHRTINRH